MSLSRIRELDYHPLDDDDNRPIKGLKRPKWHRLAIEFLKENGLGDYKFPATGAKRWCFTTTCMDGYQYTVHAQHVLVSQKHPKKIWVSFNFLNHKDSKEFWVFERYKNTWRGKVPAGPKREMMYVSLANKTFPQLGIQKDIRLNNATITCGHMSLNTYSGPFQGETVFSHKAPAERARCITSFSGETVYSILHFISDEGAKVNTAVTQSSYDKAHVDPRYKIVGKLSALVYVTPDNINQYRA